MRVALLSMLETVPGASAELRGQLTFAGKSIAMRQVDLALELGCERIVVLAAEFRDEMIALQRLAEKRAARFHVITSARALSGLVHSDDSLLVVAGGVVPLDEQAASILSASDAMLLVLPADPAVAEGFERIDLTRAWAGVMKIPGRLVERLAELPADCDPFAGLLRVALQARVAETMLPERMLADQQWLLVSSAAQARALEQVWLRRRAIASRGAMPSRQSAEWLVARIGGALVRRRIGAAHLRALALAAAAVGLLLGWWNAPASGFLLLGLACLLDQSAASVRALAVPGFAASQKKICDISWLSAIVDVAIGLLILCALVRVGTSWPNAAFPALVLLGSLHLLPRLAAKSALKFVADRMLVCVVLAASAAMGVLLAVIQVAALSLLLACIVQSRRSRS